MLREFKKRQNPVPTNRVRLRSAMRFNGRGQPFYRVELRLPKQLERKLRWREGDTIVVTVFPTHIRCRLVRGLGGPVSYSNGEVRFAISLKVMDMIDDDLYGCEIDFTDSVTFYNLGYETKGSTLFVLLEPTKESTNGTN